MVNQFLSNARQLPFACCTDYQVINEFENSKTKLLDLFNCNGFSKQINTYINDFAKDNYTCKYYNHSSFPKVLGEHDKDCLKTVHINIRSLEKNKFELKSYLETLGCKFDLIFISETGHVNISSIEDVFKGYSFIYEPPSTAKGGAGILIKNNSFESIVKLENSQFRIDKTCNCNNCLIENVWVKLKSHGKEIVTGCIYRHPGGNIEHFIRSSEHIFTNLNENSWYIIAGDININLLNINDNATNKYVSNFLQANFIPCINLPTRFCETTATLIDHIMVKVPRKCIQTKVNSGNLLVDITDHLPNFVLIDTKMQHSKERPYIRLFTKKKIEKFNQDISNFSPLITLNENETLIHSNIHLTYNEFITNYMKLLNLYFPLVKLSRSKMKNKPYITSGIKVSIKQRDKLYEKYLNNKTKENKVAWKRFRNKVKDTIKNAEKLYFKNQLNQHANSCQGLWKVFGKVIKNKQSQNDINSIKINENNITDTPSIVEEFNKYFCSIGEHLSKNFKSNNNSENYLENKIENSFFLHFTTEGEIINEINNLNPKKSSGYDEISAKFVQISKHIISKPLSLIFNQAVANGEYPDQLKVARVLPIYKKR